MSSDSDCHCRCRGGSSSGGSGEPPCCVCCECQPQVFTSVLLAFLACVLVAGGVYLALHKWDHTWLLVSAVGILLMGIGTALHCCTTHQKSSHHSCKGGCTARSITDIVGSGGQTEQLLPLSNARSVSQLSLNMVPGYFPPMVYPGVPATSIPYGLEQHSAVVQNISRVVQNQQLLQQSESGKNFIVLSLPSETNSANLVAAVYQLDGSRPAESNNGQDVPVTDISSQTTEASFISRTNDNSTVSSSANPVQPSVPCSPLLKNAEVQTCDLWPSPNGLLPNTAVPSNQSVIENATESSHIRAENSVQLLEAEIQRTENTSIRTDSSSAVNNNCSSVNSIVVESTLSSQELSVANDITNPVLRNQCLTPENIRNSLNLVAGESLVQELTSVQRESNNVICDTIETQTSDIPTSTNESSSDTNSERAPSIVVTTVSSATTTDVQTCNLHTTHHHSNNERNATDNIHRNDINVSEINRERVETLQNISNFTELQPQTEQSAVLPNLDPVPGSQNLEAALPSGCILLDVGINDDDFSDVASENSDLLARSTPPPSYEDVIVMSEDGAQDAQISVGAFGLAYGTI